MLYNIVKNKKITSKKYYKLKLNLSPNYDYLNILSFFYIIFKLLIILTYNILY
jgi:hypothetical protein